MVHSQRVERFGVAALVDDEHGHRANQVEAGHEDDEREEEISHQFLNLHYLEGFVVLLHAVSHFEFGSCCRLHRCFHLFRVVSRFNGQEQRREFAVLLEELLREIERRQQVGVVIAFLVHLEERARGEEVVDIEALRGVHHIDLCAPSRCANFNLSEVDAHAHSQSVSRHGIVDASRREGGEVFAHVVGVEDDAVDARHLSEVFVHPFERHHERVAPIENQGVFFKARRSVRHAVHPLCPQESGVVGIGIFALKRHELDFWVEGRIESRNEFAEPIEHRKHAHQGHCAHGNAECRHPRNDVDGAVAFAREEVSACEEEG